MTICIVSSYDINLNHTKWVIKILKVLGMYKSLGSTVLSGIHSFNHVHAASILLG